jgi:hypothetical protein
MKKPIGENWDVDPYGYGFNWVRYNRAKPGKLPVLQTTRILFFDDPVDPRDMCDSLPSKWKLCRLHMMGTRPDRAVICLVRKYKKKPKKGIRYSFMGKHFPSATSWQYEKVGDYGVLLLSDK